MTRPNTEEVLDVLIIGAGISGIGCACHLSREVPHKRWAILEARSDLGGTWDLFRYPGIRSDSDLHTFSYAFKPWSSPNAIAPAEEILAYLRETANEYGALEKIIYNHKVISADWDSKSGLWTVTAQSGDDMDEILVRCRWLFSATGYYDYQAGYRPSFEGEDSYTGQLIHPQHWPEDFDYTDKRIAVIGSGATAVTLVPSMTEKAQHITQIQRTPSYVMPRPKRDALANWLKTWLPTKTAHAITRWKNTRMQRYFYLYCQSFPHHARRLIRKMNIKNLPDDYPVDVHFNPPYDPWDQRICAVPDADLFKDLSSGKASIVTGHIKQFLPDGIEMASGEQIPADAIIIATGLNLKIFGGIELSIDGDTIDVSQKLVYRGLMLDGIPNFGFAIGYTNSSWTLKVDIVCEYLCKLIRKMDQLGQAVCIPEKPQGDFATRPLLDFEAGYVKRSISALPRQGEHYPWKMDLDYMSDMRSLKSKPVLEPSLKLSHPANQCDAENVA